MKGDILIALTALSIGWSMHARLAAGFCIRCWKRQAGIKCAKYAIDHFNPKGMWWSRLAFQFVLTGSVLWTILLLLQDIAKVFGWKNLLQFAQQTIKQQMKGRKN